MLERVASGEVLIRLVARNAFIADRAFGERVLPAALQTSDFMRSDQSYGASVYIESRLPDDVNLTSELGKPTHLVAKVSVADLEALGVVVCFSAEDCDKPSLKAAHASLIGVTAQNRAKILRLIDAALP